METNGTGTSLSTSSHTPAFPEVMRRLEVQCRDYEEAKKKAEELEGVKAELAKVKAELLTKNQLLVKAQAELEAEKQRAQAVEMGRGELLMKQRERYSCLRDIVAENYAALDAIEAREASWAAITAKSSESSKPDGSSDSRDDEEGDEQPSGSAPPCSSAPAADSKKLKLDDQIGQEREDTSSFYQDRVKLCSRSLGHLAAVYCVLYDRTGNNIFTGADDKLVKVWSAVNGRLLATLRGATGEITDLAVNPENTLLAAGSNDESVRVWTLHNCASVAVLQHQGQITSVHFCPMARALSPIRYLVSTTTDGVVTFWVYTENPGEDALFHPKACAYPAQMPSNRSEIFCASFSTAGVFLAAGGAHGKVRVYYMLNPEHPLRVLKASCHVDRVDSISWAHAGVRFISASRDGTALVHRYECQQWSYKRINCARAMPGGPRVVIDDPKKRPKPTMVAWNRDDSLVLTATTDFLVKVWNPLNGQLVRVLKGHSDEMYVIESHPFNPSIMWTAGHDGRIIIWDIGTLEKKEGDSPYGKILYEHQNLMQGNFHSPIFDCKLTPDGFGFAATDSHGHILIFGAHPGGPDSKFSSLPNELFFHTDYRPFVSFQVMSPVVIDKQTRTLTHLMPPPFLVDSKGNPYPAEIQRFVPGRENCKAEELVPEVAVSPAGNLEVVAGYKDNNNEQNKDTFINEVKTFYEAMRGQLQQQQKTELLPSAAQSSREPPQSLPPALRQPGSFSGIKTRFIIPPLSREALGASENQRLLAGNEEEEYYQKHMEMTSPHSESVSELFGVAEQSSTTDSDQSSETFRDGSGCRALRISLSELAASNKRKRFKLS